MFNPDVKLFDPFQYEVYLLLLPSPFLHNMSCLVRDLKSSHNECRTTRWTSHTMLTVQMHL